MNVGIQGFSHSLAHEEYRGVEIHVVDGPSSRNGYVVASFNTVETKKSVFFGMSFDTTYDEIITTAPGGWTFSHMRPDGMRVIGFDHNHSWDHIHGTTHPSTETILEELRDCVDGLIEAGYIDLEEVVQQ